MDLIQEITGQLPKDVWKVIAALAGSIIVIFWKG